MADVQLAVIDQQNTQIALVVPGVQGPIGVQGPAGIPVVASGTEAAPAISFVSDPDTGINNNGPNQLALVTGGQNALLVDASGVTAIGGDLTLSDGGTYTTALQTITPTAARTISFPDATGTVALVGGSSGQLLYNLSGAVAGTSITFDASTGTRFTLPFGYGAGAGGTVTQATNKSTGVTLNTRCGQVTMNGANLVADTAVTFTLTNTQIAATDVLMLNHVSGGTLGTYSFVARCAAGSATISVRNVTAGDLAEAVVIGFAAIKASTT